jgi:DnaK suppressor protein
MSQTIAPPISHQPSREAHDNLTRRYDEAYESFRREEAVIAAMRSGLDAGPGDEVDQATTRAQLDEQINLAQSLRDHLDDVGVAIERCEAGTYGVCENCHQAIPAERLALFPVVALCVPCKMQLERH